MARAAVFRDNRSARTATPGNPAGQRDTVQSNHSPADVERPLEVCLDDVLEHLRDCAVFTLRADRRVASWNAGARHLLGYASGEIVGECADVFFTDEDRARGAPREEAEAAARGGCANGERWHVRKDGSRFFGAGILTAVRDSNGDVSGFVKIVRDFSERREAALVLAERERLLRQANEANRVKDEFLSTVSHELRTPLNAVLGWTQLVREGHLSPEGTKKALEVIERNARSQVKLIADLFDLARVVTGQIRLSLAPTSILDAIRAAVETIRPAAEAKHLQFEVDADPEAGEVMGDPARLQQVIWNLLANAVKFTPPGGRASIALTRRGDTIEIVVSDTGIGIEPGFLPYVFDRFRQADSSTTRTEPGLGLGLAIVKHLVELQGGTVCVESAGIERGATFRVRLPALRQAESAGSSHPSSSDAHARQDVFDFAGVTIVAIDDDEDARDLMGTTLSTYGAKVIVAASVSEGLDAVRRHQPDLILTDLAMPGEDGYAFIRKLRHLEPAHLRQTPAVALTAYVRREDRARLLAAGYQAHLAKPFDLDELRITAAALLGAREQNTKARGAGRR
jgi:PAS domain S-box-containing protein